MSYLTWMFLEWFKFNSIPVWGWSVWLMYQAQVCDVSVFFFFFFLTVNCINPDPYRLKTAGKSPYLPHLLTHLSCSLVPPHTPSPPSLPPSFRPTDMPGSNPLDLPHEAPL